MPREFYTEKDIEDMVKRGTTSLELTDDVVLTELAFEKANRLGLKLVRPGAITPPSAPVRPYISQNGPKASPSSPANSKPTPSYTPYPVQPAVQGRTGGSGVDGADLHQRIRSAVIARLGSQIDSNLLDAIIKRVLNATGVR